MTNKKYIQRITSDNTGSSQANQAKVLTGGGDLRFAQVDVPLSAIPAFDRIAGLYDRHLNSNRGIR